MSEDSMPSKRMVPEQPELWDHWGCRFYGGAETVTGDVWWYVEQTNHGPIRHPLLPVRVEATRPQEPTR